MEERLPQRDAYVGRSLARFCAGQGLETSAVAEVLEAFVVSGLSGRAPSTKGTYRSVLRRIGHCQRPELATAFGASPARAPYSSAERAELAFVATAQRPAWRRASALGLLALGVGAGLRAGELVGVVGTDVVAEDRGVMVHVAGTRARVVLMDAGYAEVVSGLAERSGGGHLSVPVGQTAPIRTSSTTSPVAWSPDRGHRGFLRDGAGPVSYATTSGPAPRWARCSTWQA